MGATGRKTVSGSIWTVIRTDGAFSNYLRDMKKPVESNFGTLAKEMERSQVFGIWTSFGAKMTFGAGLQCESPESASALVTALRDSAMGKQEDQPEIPNDLKKGMMQLQQKEFSEFLSNLKYYSKGDCAYLQSFMTNKERANSALRIFANPNLGEGGQLE
jgi:hypothetical protein